MDARPLATRIDRALAWGADSSVVGSCLLLALCGLALLGRSPAPWNDWAYLLERGRPWAPIVAAVAMETSP